MTKKITDEQHYRTSDIALAAYLKLKGLKLVQCGRDGKFQFVFEDPESQAEDLALEFVNSDIRKYDFEITGPQQFTFFHDPGPCPQPFPPKLGRPLFVTYQRVLPP